MHARVLTALSAASVSVAAVALAAPTHSQQTLLVEDGTPASVLTSVLLGPSGVPIADASTGRSTSGLFTSVNGDEEIAWVVAPAGDWDGDGVPDAVISGNDELGNSHIWIAELETTGAIRAVTEVGPLPPEISQRYESAPVKVFGDLDGNGVDDLAVGVRTYNGGQGAVVLLLLESDGSVLVSHLITMGMSNFQGQLSSYAGFGSSLVAPGDLNGDGRPDLIVGAGGLAREPNYVWQLYLSPAVVVKGTVSFGWNMRNMPCNVQLGFGQRMAALGDLDGDGVDDLAVASTYDLFILFMNSDETVASCSIYRPSTALGIGGSFATTISALEGLGDLDGDGLQELAIGFANADSSPGSYWSGRVELVTLNTDGTIAASRSLGHDLSGMTSRVGRLFGMSAAAVGDLNGDGMPDLVVTSFDSDDGTSGFGDIDEALDVANSGDTLLVVDGSYEGFNVSDMSLTIEGIGSNVHLDQIGWIRSIGATDTVVLRNLSGGQIAVEDSTGVVWLDSMSNLDVAPRASDRVVVTNSTARRAFVVEASSLYAFDTTFVATAFQEPGITVRDGSTVYLSGVVAQGADSIFSNFAPGPGIELEGTAWLRDSQAIAGANLVGGPTSQNIVMLSGAQVNDVPGPSLSLVASSPVAIDGDVRLTADGPPNVAVWVGVSTTTTPLFIPWKGVATVVGVSPRLHFIGYTDARGVLDVDVPVARLVAPGVDAFFVQALFITYPNTPLSIGGKHAYLGEPTWSLGGASAVTVTD